MTIEEDVSAVITRASYFGVSDIHFIPSGVRYHLYFRFHGELHFMQDYRAEQGERMIAHLKYLTKMAIGERRLPQTGACRYQVGDQTVELRCSTITNFKFQESLVIRMIYVQQDNCEARLSMAFPSQLPLLQRLFQAKTGLLLFSGPVDSGKTSTIYHLLRARYRAQACQIITMEDPVEIEEPLFLQAEVNHAAGLDYDALIKASLRHHPDIIVIGEIRDEATAKMAVRAALTGHLVIATVHAKNGAGVLERLYDLDVSPSQLKQVLCGIVSQRLVARQCAFCGSHCHRFCNHYPFKEKRMAVCELWHGEILQQLLDQQSVQATRHLLFRQLTKAWALGFISRSVLEAYDET